MSSSIRARGLTIVAAAVALGSAVTLAGCTGPDPEPTRSAKPSASASATPAPTSVTDITDAPGTGEDFAGALGDTAVTSCEKGDGGWSVAGTAKNPTDAAAGYRIYVSFLNKANVTRGLKEITLDAVAPGATEKWSGDLAPLPDAKLTCVLRVERYAA